MSKLRLTELALAVTALLVAPGCVELTGQRITWFYDAAKDELQILIHYDGIHDSGDDQHGRGVDQVPEFIKAGSVLLLDWPFHLPMGQIRAKAKEKAEDENADPNEREWARLVASIRTQPGGYYREPNGRIGAVQLVTVSKAKQFVRKLNDLISAEILKQKANPNDDLAHTFQRMQEAAKEGHQWITLDGHAIRYAMPVHPEEWARAKAEFLKDAAENVARALGDEADQEQRDNVLAAILALGAAPVSYVDEGDRVEFIVGGPRKPATFRLQIRGEYEPSLEKVVVDSVKTDLDKTRAEALLAKDADPKADPDALWSWGPPEDQVRALLAGAGHDNAELRQAAVKRLQSWSAHWNRDRGHPQAPTPMDDTEKYLAEWRKWYGQVTPYRECKEQEETEETEKTEEVEKE